MSFFREDDDKKEVTQIQFSNYDEKADGAAAVRNLNRFRPRAKKRRIVNKKWKKKFRDSSLLLFSTPNSVHVCCPVMYNEK